MPLGTEVGLGPGDIVLGGDPAPPKMGHSTPTFRFMSVVAFSAHVYCGQTVAHSAAAEHLLKVSCSNAMENFRAHAVSVSVHPAAFVFRFLSPFHHFPPVLHWPVTSFQWLSPATRPKQFPPHYTGTCTKKQMLGNFIIYQVDGDVMCIVNKKGGISRQTIRCWAKCHKGP